jgi:very-short-patch-repair endonuclease
MLKMAGFHEHNDFAREHPFAARIGRKFRFDFAFIKQRIGVEVEGGTWTHGRHSRGVGMSNDMEKYNLAGEMGWRVFRFTPQMVKDGTAISTIERLMR